MKSSEHLSGTQASTLDLWPEGVPGLRWDASPAVINPTETSNVHRPDLEVFQPMPGFAVGTAVIICPGGGYATLQTENEGTRIAQWMTARGVTAFVLRYRLKEYGHPAPLRDVLRAVRLVRSRASEFGLDPDRLGVIGASAGGHLAGCAATLYDDPDGKTGAALDAVSARPNFAILLYPVVTLSAPYAHQGSRENLLGRSPAFGADQHLSIERQVRLQTPPTFIVSTEADRVVAVENSLLFYQALRAAGVPAELHLFSQGPHGFSFRPDLGPVSTWPALLEAWLTMNHWLDRPSK